MSETDFWREADGTKVLLTDATDSLLERYLAYCVQMLDSKDHRNPGRRTLSALIDKQLHYCNIELMMRKLECGALSADAKPYPRYSYLRDISAYMDHNPTVFPHGERNSMPVTMVQPSKLPAEFARLTIGDVIAGATDQLGLFANRHISRTFLFNIGIYLNNEEMHKYYSKERKRIEIIKEELGVNPECHIRINPAGLTLEQMRAMLTLKKKKYRDMTTIQLTTLRDKVLFLLKEKVRKHIALWETLHMNITQEMQRRQQRVTEDR